MTTPRLVKDIRLGGFGSNPAYLTAVGNVLFFRANDGVNGYALWKTDGTSAGTVLVKDINTSTYDPFFYGPVLRDLTAVGNTLFFRANKGSGGEQLWKSDGTATGTLNVAAVNPEYLTPFGNILFFRASDSTNGTELWKSDGTTAGTVLVKDINPGSASSYIANFTAVGSTVFFSARDGVRGSELWKTDGTTAGTVLVKDINPGSAHSYVGEFTTVGNTLFFITNDGFSGRELWTTDGTAAGTLLLKDINPGSSGSAGGLTALGNTLFFSANDGVSGQELWKSDGTVAGTVLVKDILNTPNNSQPWNLSSNPTGLTAVGNTLFFEANDGVSGRELWKSDGTTPGTVLVKDITPVLSLVSSLGQFKAVGNTLFFSASDADPRIFPFRENTELWKSDGTTAGTRQVAEIRQSNYGPNNSGAFPRSLSLVGNTLYFTAFDGVHGEELWALDVSDLISEPNRGSTSFTISGLLAPNNYLHAALQSSDPDGNGSFTYSWQTSSNGSSWSTVGSNRSSYRLTANDAGKQLRLLVSYKDGGGFNETVVTAAGTVAYSPTHQNLEILAKDIIYKKTPFAIGFSIEELPGFPYVVNKIWNDTGTGLYALGLSAPNAPSVLVFRGTGDKLDIWDDLNPNGIGFGQFTAAHDGIPVYDSIRQWLRDQASTFAPIITGHSLGGSLAQWAAADATGNGKIKLGEVVTFNSPGISPSQTFAANQFGANVFNPLLAGNVTHYITSTDLVSLGGTNYLPGSYKLFDYSSLLDPVVGPHLNPVLVPTLPVSLKTRPTGGDPVEKPFWFLNSPLYGYNTDIDFVVLRLAIAGVAKLAAAIPGIGTVVASIINSVNKALRSRFDTEKLRTSLGEVLYLPGVRPALENAMSFASIAAEAATERVQTAFSALVSGGREALDAIANLPGDIWDEIANATSTTWNSLSKWTGNAWSDSVGFSTSVWQSLISPTFNFAKPFITTAVKQVFRLPTTSGFLPFAAAASFEPSVVEDQASPVQTESLRSFSLASFTPLAALQTIDVSVALSQASAELVTLQFLTVDRTAQAGVDYNSLSGTLQFQPGETEKLVTIELLTPPQASGKDFTLRLSNLQNAQFLVSEDIVVSLLANQAPVVATAPADRFAPIEEPLLFALPSDTFSDVNSSQGDLLVVSASLSDGSPLPAWLQFDPQTLSFTGTPPASALSSLAITVTATDSAQGRAAATFALMLVANDGAATFSISGTPAVGNTLTATNSAPDPDGNGTFSYAWQSSSDGSTWNPVGTKSPSYLIASADQGKQLRLVVSYADGEGFVESVTTAAGTVPFVNDGPASFSITGTPTIGNTLTATTSSTDPDGNGTFSYTWQSSRDGTTWLSVGSQSSLLITTALAGRQLRLQVAYQDGQAFDESVNVLYGLVPLPAGAPQQSVVITALSDNLGILQGPIAEGAISNDTTPTLTGTLSAALGSSETLRVYRNDATAGTATVSGLNWTYTPTTPLVGNGIHPFTAAVVKGSGLSGQVSDPRSMVLDATAPTQTVTISGVSDNSDPVQGAIAAGGRTNDTTPTISGNLSAPLGEGETLKLYNGNTFLVDAVVDATTLTWTATPTLAANGTYTLRARVQDQAGNQGPLSAGRTLIFDTVAPAQTVTISGLSDNVGITQGPIAEGGTTNDTTPTLSGTFGGATAGAALATGETLLIYSNGTIAGNAKVTVVAAGQSTWSYTPSPALTTNGTYSFSAQVIDGAGNSGPLSAPRSIVLDTIAPLQTVSITSVSDNTDPVQGVLAAGGRTNDTTPTITGTIGAALAAGETLRIFNGATLLGSATVNNTARTWTYTPTLPSTTGTTYSLTARVADAAGNLGVASAARTFVLDTTAPATSAAITGVTDNVGIITGTVAAGGRTNDTTPTITGTLSAALASGETLRVFNGATLLGSATVNNTALTWSYMPTLPASAGTTYNITARVADAAGNLGTTSAARACVLDTTAPATTVAIAAVSDNVGLIKGTIATGGRTDDRTPSITGTISAALAAGETLRVYNGSTLLGSATVNNTARTWSYTPTLPASAGTTYSITARVADAAGNLGTASAARTLTLDTTAPATTTAIIAVTDNVGLIQGSVAAGGRTDDRTPTITGTISAALAAGETLRVYNGSTLLGSASVNNTAKTWSYSPTLPASAGTTYSITARVADAAGNLATASAARSFILDTGVESDVSYVLEPNQSSLRLTGTRRINGTGNNLDNTIIGNSANNRIAGLGGKDILTGGGGTADRDVFVFLQLSDSLLLDPISGTGGYFEEITDFNSNDRITAPFSVETDLLTASLGNAASIAPAAIAAVLTTAAFTVNSVVAFTASSHAGTFIAMNDGRAGFQADTDSILLLRNYSISATNFVEFV